MESLLRRQGLHTVCESALCPNLGECFARGTATFLIMGDMCTRSCSFCGVATGRPGAWTGVSPSVWPPPRRSLVCVMWWSLR